jgi:hypothetical protein
MKNTLYILLLLISFAGFSQNKALELKNKQTGKTILFEENQRIKVRTLDGKKSIGKLTFSDNETLIINNKTIKLDSLQSVKTQPRVLGTIKTIVLATGLSVVGASLIAAAKGNNAAFLLFTVGSGITITSGILEGLNANNINRKWEFKIIKNKQQRGIKLDLTN